MEIITKIVLDIASGEVLERESYEYSGPVELAKGADTANQQRQAELKMQQEAFDRQSQQLDFLNKQFSKYLTGNIGFDPRQLTATRSNFLNTNSSTFNQAGSAVRSALRARGSGGGDQPVGGDYTRGIAGLMGAQASDRSQGLLNLNIQDALQALTNRFNAGSVLSGNAATLTGTQGVAGAGASSALNSYITAKNSGLMQSFASSLGQGLGGGLSAFATGGFGSLGSLAKGGPPASVPYGASQPAPYYGIGS